MTWKSSKLKISECPSIEAVKMKVVLQTQSAIKRGVWCRKERKENPNY